MENFGNDKVTALASGVLVGATSIVITDSTNWPAVNFRIRVDNELMLVTNKGAGSQTTWSVTRGIEGTVASEHLAGAAVYQVFTLGGFEQRLSELLADVPKVITVSSATSIFGDSNIANANIAPPSTIVSGSISGIFSNSHIGWWNELMDSAGMVGFDIVSYHAVAGAGVQSVIDNQLPAILAAPSSVALGRVLVNNFGTLTEQDSVYAAMAKMKVLLDALSAGKDLVVIESVNPVYQSGSASPRLRAGEFEAINAALAQLCSTYRNVKFNDTYSAIVDPASNVRDALPNTLNTVDGIHYVSNGAYLAGYKSFYNMKDKFKLYRYKTKGSNLLPAWAGTGGNKTEGSGTITGTPPAGWNCQVVSGSASVVLTTQSPDRIRATITNSGGSDSLVGFYLTTPSYTALSALLTAGDTIQGSFGYMHKGGTLLKRIAAAIRFNFSGLGTNAPFVSAMTQQPTNEPTIVYPQKAMGGVRKTPPVVIPPSFNSVDFFITCQVGPSTGAVVLDIYNPELYKLT